MLLGTELEEEIALWVTLNVAIQSSVYSVFAISILLRDIRRTHQTFHKLDVTGAFPLSCRWI